MKGAPGAVVEGAGVGVGRSLGTVLLGLGLAAVLGWPGVSFAWPVDVRLELLPEKEHIQRLASISWIDVEDPSVVEAEVLPSGELMLVPKKAGQTLALLYADGKMAVWRLVVGGGGPEKGSPASSDGALAVARKACPGLKAEGQGGDAASLQATVKDERCRKALLSLFQTDAFLARQVELLFEVEVLQQQLRGVSAEASPKAQLSYLGAGLVLKGTLTEAEHRKTLWAIFRRSVGKVVLEDVSER